jgi:AcrR family transcriptional regulator
LATTTTARNRRDEQRERTRADLLDAAARVFAAQGYHAASVDQVAEAAGYTKGAVYSNFDSKEELFLELLERHLDQAIGLLEQLVLDKPPLERADAFAAQHERLAVLDRDWFLLEAEFLLYAARNEQVRDRVAARQRRTHARITAIARRHLDDLGISDEVLDAADAARILMATADGLTQAALADDAVAVDGGRLLVQTMETLVRDALRRRG